MWRQRKRKGYVAKEGWIEKGSYEVEKKQVKKMKQRSGREKKRERGKTRVKLKREKWSGRLLCE